MIIQDFRMKAFIYTLVHGFSVSRPQLIIANSIVIILIVIIILSRHPYSGRPSYLNILCRNDPFTQL